MNIYPVVEIFHSVQGEDFSAGIPHVFIDLVIVIYDVNGVILILSYKNMSLKEIVAQVLSYDCDGVIFGGEPCMQD